MSTLEQQKKMAAFVTCIASADLMEQRRVLADLAAHAGVSPSEYEAMNQQELIACVEQSLKSMVDQVVARGHGPAFKSVSGDVVPVHHVRVDHYVGVHAPHEHDEDEGDHDEVGDMLYFRSSRVVSCHSAMTCSFLIIMILV